MFNLLNIVIDNTKCENVYYIKQKEVDAMTLGEIVKEYRENHKMSMDDFSKLCGLSKGYISMLEKNVNPTTGKAIAPSLETIRQIAVAINTDINTLIEQLDSKQKVSLVNLSSSKDSDANYVKSDAVKLDKKEKALINYYRNSDEFGQKAILLTAERELQRSKEQIQSDGTIVVKTAARSSHNRPIEDMELTNELVQKIKNAPKVTDENDL